MQMALSQAWKAGAWQPLQRPLYTPRDCFREWCLGRPLGGAASPARSGRGPSPSVCSALGSSGLLKADGGGAVM